MTDDLLYARVASHLFGRPLLLLPSTAESIAAYMRGRMLGQGPEANRFVGENQFDPKTDRWKGYRAAGNVGIVSIHGELVNRGAWLGASSGLTSYEGIVEQTRQAGEDDRVSSIAFDFNSPGGEALGMSDTSRTIRRLTKGKRTVAVLNAMAASAAYGLASAMDEIVIGESAVAGSIGVVLMHADYSGHLEDRRIKVTLIHAGAQKVTGNPFEPLTEEALAMLQADVDTVMNGFVSLVADHRPKLSQDAIRGQEARIFHGKDAVDAGLADRIGTFEDVLSELRSAPIGRTISQTRRHSMSEQTGAPDAETQTGIPKADHDAAVAAAREAGIAQGKADGAQEATERFAAVLGAKGIKGDSKRMAAALDLATRSPDMAADAVVDFVSGNVSANDDEVSDYERDRHAASGQTQHRPDTKKSETKIDRRAIYESRRQNTGKG